MIHNRSWLFIFEPKSLVIHIRTQKNWLSRFSSLSSFSFLLVRLSIIGELIIHIRTQIADYPYSDSEKLIIHIRTRLWIMGPNMDNWSLSIFAPTYMWHFVFGSFCRATHTRPLEPIFGELWTIARVSIFQVETLSEMHSSRRRENLPSQTERRFYLRPQCVSEEF